MPILSVPIFLLQEASFRVRRLRVSRWITTLKDRDAKAFRHWYIRNVYHGQELELKMEMRIRANGTLEDFKTIQQAGEGRITIGNRMYSGLDLDTQPSMIWDQLCRRNPAFSGPLTEPSTHDFFPERRHKYQPPPPPNQPGPAIHQGLQLRPKPKSEAMDLDA